MRMGRLGAGVIVTAVALLATAGVAQAGFTNKSYNTTVGSWGGKGYTGTDVKVQTDADAYIKSVSVGGSYQVDACVALPTTGWCTAFAEVVRLDDNVTRYPGNSVVAGNNPRIMFTNDWNTVVNVQVTGQWRSN